MICAQSFKVTYTYKSQSAYMKMHRDFTRNKLYTEYDILIFVRAP